VRIEELSSDFQSKIKAARLEAADERQRTEKAHQERSRLVDETAGLNNEVLSYPVVSRRCTN
jgi:hypothetical protein